MKNQKRVGICLWVRVLGAAAGLSAVTLTWPVYAQQTSDATPQPGYVETPAGLVHKSCIFEVPMGARVDEHRDVRDRSGDYLFTVPKCAYPAKRTFPGATSQEVAPTVDSPPDPNHGWVENVYDTGVPIDGRTKFSGIEAYWTVPPAPLESTGQVLYLFDSLTSPDFGGAILQPVLQWGDNGDFGGDYWSLADWYLIGDSVLHTQPFTTYPGDTIRGTVLLQNSESDYEIEWVDETQGLYWYFDVTLDVEPFGVVVDLNAAQPGVLEEWDVDTCYQYPGDGVYFPWQELFTGVHMWEEQDSFFHIQEVGTNAGSWGQSFGGVTPNCNFGLWTGANGEGNYAELQFGE